MELLRHAIDKAGAHCLVSSSLAAPVRVEAVIRASGVAVPAVAYKQTA